MRFRKIQLPVLIACYLSAFASSASAAPSGKTSQLTDPEQIEESANTMFREYWQIVLNDSPESATMLGDHRYADRLDSYSLKCYEKRKVVLSEFLERANQMLPLANEGSDTHNNLELFVINLRNKLDYLMSGYYLFPLSMMQTPAMNLQYLLKYVKLNETEDYRNLISRYLAVPAQIDELIELMREGIRTNFTLNEHSMVYNFMNANDSLEDTPFYKPFSNISNFVPDEEKAVLQVNASDAISNCIMPAFEKLSDFLKNEYKQHLRPGVGVDQLPNGPEFYRQQLAHHLTDSTITPEQVHAMGISEVERISEEMDQVISSLGLNMTRQEFSEQLRNDQSNFFKSEEEVLETYRSMIEDEIEPKLSLIFKTVPQKILTVDKMTADMATGPRAYYLRASPDGSTPATFYIDASSLNNLPKYEVVTLSLHEGVPGHHFQISYAMERSDVPDFRRHDIEGNAFIEGWALYAEYLGKEMGLYSDPKMWYGHLSEEIFRACRMVVDTGIHVLGWSRQQAIDYMMNNSASTLNNIEREVDRYITWPGQACAYKFGEMKIKELRFKAQNELGTKFDVKEFHDVVLKNNGPLELLEKQVNRYIAAAKISTIKSY
ncbi:uncharacterized protein LOC129222580 [Uloborus diversus]|uniref:uncharacterized protein LOC129222580 n=1 Tax=Uloborus diversus TaxID=327109 RepID=UPI00240A31B2|nr:uncharacterized protein LOC129222580 [Uloborus diversus]